MNQLFDFTFRSFGFAWHTSHAWTSLRRKKKNKSTAGNGTQFFFMFEIANLFVSVFKKFKDY